MEIDGIQILFGILIGGITIGGPLWFASKKLLKNFVKAAEDNKFTSEELIGLLADGFGIIAVLKILFRK